MTTQLRGARSRTAKGLSLKPGVGRLQRTEQAIEALIALALRPQPVTEAEMECFCEEYTTNERPLSKADEAALKKCRPELFRQIKDIIRGKPANDRIEPPRSHDER